MKIELPVAEALTLATSRRAIPSMIESISCENRTLEADIDLREITTSSLPFNLLKAAAGTVTVTATFVEFSDDVASFAITASSRGLPAHKLLGLLVDQINGAIDNLDLPEGLLVLERGEDEPVLRIDAQKALGMLAPGMTVTDFELSDSIIYLETRA